MKKLRITTLLYDDEKDALFKMSEDQRRTPQDQAAALIREGLINAGYLPAGRITEAVTAVGILE